MTGDGGIGGRIVALAAAALVGGVVGAGAAGWIGAQRERAAREGEARRFAALALERDALAHRADEEAAGRAALAASPAGAPAFDPAPVLAAGFPPEEVDRFRARLDELELERLYLRDRATREGWLDTPRFREESGALGREFLGLRDEFDEGLYDWVMYSTGHPNRVAVTEVLSGSAAEAAGLRNGDVIVRYDQRLVLSPTELRDATATGRAGELVAIEVQRTGDPAPLRVFVPRGPLGVRMTPTRVTPPPAG